MKTLFKGSYKDYYNFVKKQEIFNNGYVRIKKNFSNLGIWMVKDSQGKYTLNIFKYRVQF